MGSRELRAAVERVFRAVRPLVVEAYAEPRAPTERKSDGTVVTDLDRRLEDELADGLLALDARWGLFGEEGGLRRDGESTWHLDPLDGTLNFVRRIPLFACQAALVDEAGPRLAVIYDPLRDDLAWAERAEGAWREGRRLAVSTRPIDRALVLTDISRTGVFVTDPDALPRLRRKVFRMRSLGSVGVHLRAVASGEADAYLASRRWPSPLHDVAPGVLLVREAGGKVTTFDDGDATADPRSLLAAAPPLHAELQGILG